MDDIFNKLIAQTYTIVDLHRRLALVKRILETKFFAGDAKAPEVEDRDRAWLDSVLPISSISKENITEVFHELEERIHTLSPLVIFVPVMLSEEEVADIGTIVRRDYGAHFVIEIRLDPLLIGGAALAWNGIYKDYSLRKKIDERKEEIIGNFQKYIR